MKTLFYYNWQVRNEWFDWCSQLTPEELLKKRIGGVGNILHTLLHIAVVEYDWINDLKGNSPFEFNPEQFTTLDDVRKLSDEWHPIVKDYVDNWSDSMSSNILTLNLGNKTDEFSYWEVMNHVIAHEIHHIGQLSVWSRELGITPITANLIRRGLK